MTGKRRRYRRSGEPTATTTVTDEARDTVKPAVDQVREVALEAFERIKAAREKAAKRLA